MVSESSGGFFYDLAVTIYANPFYLTIALILFSAVSFLAFTSSSFFSMILMTSAYVGSYGWRHGLEEPSLGDARWAEAIHKVAKWWRGFGRVWHGYEVEGLEHIPAEGSALLVFYHGSCPYDMYLLTAELFLSHKRLLRIVTERLVFKFPFIGPVLKMLGCIPGSVDSCAESLKEGNLLFIAPGGAYESQFSNNSYQLKWRNRMGYAKIAIKAKAPIIPVFTVNIGEVCRTVFSSLTHDFYLKWRVPSTPIYGGFPVKLRTVIGKPIPYDPNVSVEELANKTKTAMEAIIKEHQRVPGSILHALFERVYSSRVKKEA